MSSSPHRLPLVLVMVLAASASGCTWLKRCAYEPSDRDSWQQPERVVKELSLLPGSIVADVGSGGGYFTFRLARAVGPDGRVFASDVDQGLNGYVAERARDLGLRNVKTLLAEPDDPLLPEGAVDLVFTSNTYHHLSDRTAYFQRLRRALRPGGRVAIVEFAPRDSWLPLPDHSTPPALIRAEMQAAGYELVKAHDFLERQSFQIFRAAR